MSLYTQTDSRLLTEKVDEIMKNAEAYSSLHVHPTKELIKEIFLTVKKFVIDKERKVYGGFALNMLLGNIAPSEKIYDDENPKAWDIDFYSPDPISDAKEITHILSKMGMQYVMAREALHNETYTVMAETVNCADISYVPRNIYNKIPFTKINGMIVTNPHFMMIDYFRVMTDPLTSFFRLEKTFTRLCIMLKHFPLPHSTSSIDIIPPDKELDVAFHKVHEFLTDRETAITVGMYAYNHLIKESEIRDGQKNRDNKQNRTAGTKQKKEGDQYIDFIDVNYYEVISTQYKRDARDLILSLRKTFSNERITYQENYPFFQYLGYSVNIYFDNEIICKMYHYNSRCTPFFDVPALYFKNKSYDELPGKIRVGSYALLMMYALITVMKARTDNDINTKNLYYTIISHMIDMKNSYFKKTNKTILDESLFQEFIIRCTGSMLSQTMEKQIRIEKKRKAGKKFSWNYNPGNERDVGNDMKYIFLNSSGNPINNDKNMKIDLSDNTNIGEIDDENDENDESN
jgi:hypothetical protein